MNLPGGSSPRGLGAYLHVPFCFHKCSYCDFYSLAEPSTPGDRQERFTSKLIDEIHTASTTFPQIARPETIFIGGGTPTLLRLPLWERLLSAINTHLQPAGGLQSACAPPEFTVEANPETVTPELAVLLASGGVNRVSIGAQSFNPAHLKTLERWHEPKNVGRAVDRFRDAGITRINLDLIFGIPGQSLDDWLADLKAALALQPSHLSCYGLMYEPNTALTMRMRRGEIAPVDDDLEAAMYEATIDTLGEAGFEHYEISAWARSDHNTDERCRHNLIYWTNGNWWPFGPSASGHWSGTRWKNVPRTSEYLDQTPWPPITDVEQVEEDARIGEELMLGLRLIKGIERPRVDEMLRRGTRAEDRASAIERSVEAGLLQWSENHLRLTRRGLLLADEVLAELV